MRGSKWVGAGMRGCAWVCVGMSVDVCEYAWACLGVVIENRRVKRAGVPQSLLTGCKFPVPARLYSQVEQNINSSIIPIIFA